SRLPGHRAWTVLLVLPIAIPDFVAGYAWHTIAPTADPLLAATVVMTLGTYPLVYLPVAAALRRSDPAYEESAYSLGVGQFATFRRVTLPMIRTAILGGCTLVALVVISEYGAFEIVRFQTFTTEIFTEFQFDPPAASILSVPLALLAVVVLGASGLLAGRARADRVAPRRLAGKARLGRTTWPIVVALGCPVVAGIGVPVGTLLFWMARGQHTTLPPAATLLGATWATIVYSATAAGLAVLLALPVALLTFRSSSRPRRFLERSTYLTQAMPGVIVALGLVFLATRAAYPLYHTGILLVGGYVILHFSLAFVCVKTSVAQAPPRLVDVARSLGRGRISVFWRIT
ncbi:MAG: ABC transporter permease, partial [Candidatus Limnocylindrales bacterium]